MQSTNLVLAEYSKNDLFKITSALKTFHAMAHDICFRIENNRHMFVFEPMNCYIELYQGTAYVRTCDALLEGPNQLIVSIFDHSGHHYNDTPYRVDYDSSRKTYKLEHDSKKSLRVNKKIFESSSDIPVLETSADIFQYSLLHNESELNAMFMYHHFDEIILGDNSYMRIGEKYFSDFITMYDNMDELRNLMYDIK